MQAPMNSEALAWLIPGANSPGTVSSQGVMSKAIRKGATTPEADTAMALRALDSKWSSRSVRPTKNM